MSEWILASHNQGKLREFAELVAPHAIILRSAGELGLPEPEETGDTFEANAILKAEAARDATGMAAISDDSGLAVSALGGAPGIYSARWAGPNKDFTAAMARVERELFALKEREEAQGADHAVSEGRGGSANNHAYFVCVIAVARPNLPTLTFRGEVHGHLSFPPRGTKGFGYDPIFIPEGCAHTFGEMEPATKHTISHRTRAFDAFIAWLDTQEESA